ncbi:hypothetical protein HR45_05755 [Shewanella mangrovi]|uniref:Uncharacterized protein n=1 Tax=Shewanella mangrovi TaxID=1515746 RepID=A0A094K037_9GAMM|nr:hypothetical protein [Shewanella mangrovi]KFZ38016.1 hypothetical protein HR45_05755 [Shewanella mangrovi]
MMNKRLATLLSIVGLVCVSCASVDQNTTADTSTMDTENHMLTQDILLSIERNLRQDFTENPYDYYYSFNITLLDDGRIQSMTLKDAYPNKERLNMAKIWAKKVNLPPEKTGSRIKAKGTLVVAMYETNMKPRKAVVYAMQNTKKISINSDGAFSQSVGIVDY